MRKLLLGFIIFFAFLITFTLIFQNKLANHYLDKELTEFNTPNQYFHYQNLNVSIFDRKIELKGVEYSNNKMGIEFSAPKIEVQGISIYKILFKKEFQLNQINLKNPSINYHKQAEYQSDTNSKSTSKAYIKIKHFKLEGGNLKVILDSVKSLSTANFNLKVSNFTLHPKESNKQFIYESFESKSDSITYNSTKNQLKVVNLSLGSKNEIKIDEVLFKNKSENIRIATDLSMNLHKLSIALNYDSLLYAQHIYADSITIDSFLISAVANQVHPKSADYTSWQVVESLNKVELLQYIGKIALHKGQINYKTYSPKGEKLNSIFFNEVNATIANINKEIRNDSIATLSYKSKFMDACQVDLTIDFNLKSTNEQQHVQGRLKAFDPALLNPLFMQLANAKIKSGYIDKFTFNFFLNSKESNGDLDLKYRNLKIKIPDDGKKGKINLDFAKEFAANILAINNNNEKEESLVVGEIHFQREKEKSVFNYWWKSLASGITDVVLNPSVGKNKEKDSIN